MVTLQQSPVSAKPKLLYIEAIRAIAILLVLLVHTASEYLYKHPLSEQNIIAWWTANLFASFGRPCVPWFIMLSGILMLNPAKSDEPIRQFFQKRLGKIFIPFLGCSVAFVLWRKWFRLEPVTLLQAVREWMAGTIAPHLWFVYLIMGLYILTPILRVYVKKATPTNFVYFLSVWFVIEVLIPIWRKFTHWDIQVAIFAALGGFTGLFVLGYFLQQVRVQPRWHPLLWGVFLSTGLFTAWSTYIATLQAGGIIDAYFYTYMTPHVVLMSVSSYLLVRDCPYEAWKRQYPKLSHWMEQISLRSFSIYLIHPFFIELFQSGRLGFQMTQLPIPAIVVIPIVSAIVLILCLSVIGLIRAIPYGKAIAP